MRQRFAGDDHRRLEIYVELERDVLRVLLGERAADADAGRVDEDVHPSVALGVRRHCTHAFVGVPEVGRDGGSVDDRKAFVDQLLSIPFLAAHVVGVVF